MCLPSTPQPRLKLGFSAGLTVIITTLDFISRSEALLAPPKYHLEMKINASHGRSFNVGTTNGMEEIPLLAISNNIGIGMMRIKLRCGIKCVGENTEAVLSGANHAHVTSCRPTVSYNYQGLK